jgi:hypothetical protein
MNWEAIGAIGEVAGAAGVIVTLAYLAIQIRLNTKVVNETATGETYRSFSGYRHLLTDPHLASLYARRLDD